MYCVRYGLLMILFRMVYWYEKKNADAELCVIQEREEENSIIN